MFPTYHISMIRVAIGRRRAIRIPRGVSTTPRAGTESSGTESLLDQLEIRTG